MQINMKKIIIAVIATISCLSAIGQSGQRPLYLDDYLYPRYMASGCYDTNLFDLYPGMGWNCGPFAEKTIIAQPFYIDSTISIKGITIFTFKRTFLGDHPQALYLQIRDSSRNNVIAQVRYDTMTPKKYDFQNGINAVSPTWYIELLFDSAITINSSVFYAAMTFRDKNLDPASHRFPLYGVNKYQADCANVRDFPVLVGIRQEIGSQFFRLLWRENILYIMTQWVSLTKCVFFQFLKEQQVLCLI